MGSEAKKAGGFKAKLSGFYQSKYFFGVTAFITFSLWLLYYVLADKLLVGSVYYVSEYIFVYDHGYVSRGLIGEILSWFVDIVTPEIILAASSVLSVIFIISASFTIGYVLNRAREDSGVFNKVLPLVVLLIIFPATVSFFLKCSHFDKLLWALTFAAVLSLEKKSTMWLCPVICVLCVMVNPYFVVGSMLLIAVILLQKLCDSGCSGKNIVLCAVSYALIIGMAIFATASEQHLGFENAKEMYDYYYARYSVPLSAEDAQFVQDIGFITYFNSIFKVKSAVQIMYNMFREEITGIVVSAIFLVVPAWSLIIAFWRKAMKLEENKFQKFVFFVCAALPAVAVVFTVFGWTIPRYFGTAVLVQICLVIYYLINGNETVKAAADAFINWGRQHIAACVSVAVYFAYITAIVF